MRNPVRVGGGGGGDGTGFGLVGLAEPAAASHGRVEHGRAADRGFVLWAVGLDVVDGHVRTSS